MSKAKIIHTTKSKPNSAVVSACVTYMSYMAAIGAAFAVDPTDNVHAEKVANKLYPLAEAVLKSVASKLATNAEELCAKARAVRVLLDDNTPGHQSEVHERFIRTFSADVEAFVDAVQSVVKNAGQS